MSDLDKNLNQGIAKGLSPSGLLRAAINLGNPILANRDAACGMPSGVSVDIARELAQRLGVGVDLITFDGAAQSVEAVKTGQADVGFFAIDPLRGTGIQFTAPYVLIEGSYLVRQDSPLQTNAQVDAAGHRVAVGRGSAYDLFLTRELKAAQVIRGEGADGAVATFESQNLDALAGIRLQLEALAADRPGLRLLPGRFMVIQQAMGCARSIGEEAGAYLDQFVAHMKTSGFVADAMKRHNIRGASVAP